MSIDEQVRIMEKQLSFFESLIDKMQYMNQFFDPDPEFTQEARDQVRSNICRSLKDNG